MALSDGNFRQGPTSNVKPDSLFFTTLKLIHLQYNDFVLLIQFISQEQHKSITVTVNIQKS